MAASKTLYLCYFGLLEPLVQTQVLPYLRELSKGGLDVTLLTFESNSKEAWTTERLETEREKLRADGIRWLWLPYHKRPSLPATAYDIVRGALKAARLVRREGIEVLHARAHIPMAMALIARRLVHCRLIFDIRGLMAEEYADAGIWKEGSLPFRLMKRLERAGAKRADQIVVLTKRMRAWLIEQGLAEADRIEVIPCCVDFQRFDKADDRAEASAEDSFEVVYAGSVTGLYLLEEMGRFFLEVRAREPRALFRILTKSPAEETAARLARVGLKENEFRISAVSASQVPMIISRARLGISFRKPTFSQIAASPTKIPEYLAAGLPVISNEGIGDTDEIVESESVGIIVRELNSEAYVRAAEGALSLASESGIEDRCKRVARECFDLNQIGGVRYRKVYERVGEQMFPVGRVVNIQK